MSVSDPLIKDIKGCVQEFFKEVSQNEKITDNYFYFVYFCQILEKIFNYGLIINQNTLYFIRTIDPFCWMGGVAKEKDDIITYTYINCVDNVRSRSDLRNNTAKFRYLVKNCLTKRCLHVPVEFLIRSHKYPIFYTENSILGNEILSEILLSVLLQIGKFNFSLDLENCSFLDISWYMPEVLNFELVPCKAIGVSVSFSQDRAVIVNIQSSGVAAETEQVHIGDILDKLNGVHITTASKGRLNSILRQNKAKPVQMTIIKSYQQSNNDFYPPVFRLFKDLKLDVNALKRQYYTIKEDEDVFPSKKCYGYEVTYLGYIFVGEDGSVKQIEKATKLFVANNTDECDKKSKTICRINKKITFEIGEIGVRVRDPESNELIAQHTYMSISSCGSTNLLKNNFAYIAGDEVCDKAKTFNCFIFNSDNMEEISTILQSIGQGFHRTHFAV